MANFPCTTKMPGPLPDVIYNSSDIGLKRIYSCDNYSKSYVIKVENVDKSFVTKNGSPAPVLTNFSMQVSTGAIYSLLGSSGCGKTTILSCIVGLSSWESGRITVLGREQGVRNNQYIQIGKRIGYMPQDLALYEYLTTKEMFRYYAKLFAIENAEIEDRWRVLSNLLKLSFKCADQIQNLSGGQKRRVSLALALVHKPDLLILDEPTVGLDPLLRKSIWEYLNELVRTGRTSVLLTTHYIEECRFANTIGIMRNGRLLIEDSPENILSTTRSSLLQNAILQICKTDSLNRKVATSCISFSCKSKKSSRMLNKLQGKIRPKSSIDMPDEEVNKSVEFCGFKIKSSDEIQVNETLGKETPLDLQKHDELHDKLCTRRFAKSMSRIASFSTVIWIYFLRQPIFAFILVFMPAVQLFMTFFVVGKEPVDLAVGNVNFEILEGFDCRNISYGASCDVQIQRLSCLVQNDLFRNPKLSMIKLQNTAHANELLEMGSIFGFVTFPKNYSQNLVNRFVAGKFASDDDTLEGSKISITLDKSHYLAYHIILREILTSLDNLSLNLESSCGFDYSHNEIPIVFREPVYGKLNGTHQDSIMPAIVAQILFEILYGIAPMILIKDLKQGTFARSNLAGLRFSEFLLGIFATMGPITILQSVSCYIILEYGFDFEVKGQFLLFILLCLVAGLCGQGFGIFMGVLLKCEFSVIVSAIMVVPIIMTCSGTLWPLESHPYYLTVIYITSSHQLQSYLP